LSLRFPVGPQYIEVKDALDSKAQYAGELVGWNGLKLSLALSILQLFGAVLFLLPLLVTAFGVLLLAIEVGNVRQRKSIRLAAAVAPGFYLFLGLYRAVLELLPASGARDVLGAALLVLAAVGALLLGSYRLSREKR
jgi:hypothetical protein